MEPQKKYSFFEAGEVENKIAGTRVADPLGVLMVQASSLWQAYSDWANNIADKKLLRAAHNYFKADSAINDDNIKVRSLKRVRAWMDAIIVAFEWCEKNIDDPTSRGLQEISATGDAAHPLANIVAYSGWLWHDTCKAIANEIGTPLRESVDGYYAKDKAITCKNAKIKALKRIRIWLDVIIDAVAYIEERTEPLFQS